MLSLLKIIIRRIFIIKFSLEELEDFDSDPGVTNLVTTMTKP